MDVDIEEDKNEPELTYPYKEMDPLNPPPPASESEPEDAIEVENLIEHEDETIPSSVHKVGESSTAPLLRKDMYSLLPSLMKRDINSLYGQMASLLRRLYGHETVHALVEKKGKAKDEFYGKLILDLGNEVRSSVEQGEAAMEKLVEKLCNVEDKVECKKLKKKFKEARIMPLNSTPLTQAAIFLMIKDNVDAAIDVRVIVKTAMKMEHYLSHTDYPIWQVIQNGNGLISFTTDTNEGLHKGYDRFQTILSQLEIHGTGISHEDANQKFLRSLPSSWSQVTLIMRTKPGLDTLSFDDLYNNLRVFKRDVKGTTASSSSYNTHNVAFVSADNTSNTDDVSTAYSVSSPSISKSHKEGSSSYTNEMDLKWQMAMISMRIKKFNKRIGRKLQFDTWDPVDFDKTKVECFNCHKMRHFARECRAKGNHDKRRDARYNENKARDNGRRPAYQDDSKALVTIDGEDIDWSGHVEEDT
nr:hypothetical protein [Tanacetum cinerariifolium]